MYSPARPLVIPPTAPPMDSRYQAAVGSPTVTAAAVARMDMFTHHTAAMAKLLGEF